MNFIKSYYDNNSFIKKIITLMSGTVLSQIINFFAMIVIVKIYSPEEFGEYALFSSISAVLVVMLAGRYELAIILPKKSRFAINILCITVLFAFFMCCGLGIVIYFFLDNLQHILAIRISENIINYIPLFAFLSIVYQALYYWFNRYSEYRLMTNSKLIFVLANVSIAYYFGKYKVFSNGLIYSAILGQLFTVLYFIYYLIKKYRTNFLFLNFITMREMVMRYIDFPKFSLLGDFFSVFSSQLPIFLLNRFYGQDVIGYYSLGNRCITAPLQVIAQSFGDLFRKEASKDFHEHGNCKECFLKFANKLFFIGLFLFLPILLFGQEIFSNVFGVEWREAGTYAQILVPMFIFRCVASPLSMMSIIAEKQKYGLYFQIFMFLFIAISIYSAHNISHSGSLAVVFISVTYSIIYLISIILGFNWSKGEK